MRINEWLVESKKHLLKAGIDHSDSEFEPRLIIQTILNLSNAQLITRLHHTLSNHEMSLAREMLHRRINREPLSQILGEWEFWSLPFKVTANTLTPRPDTEVLIEELIRWSQHSLLISSGARIIDVGTGTGCIGLSLASELPELSYELIDLCPQALEVARMNTIQLRELGKLKKSTQVRFVQSDLLMGVSKVPAPIAIVSNPPYIRRAVTSLLEPEVIQYEPHIALFGADDDGLGHVRKIASMAIEYLEKQGGLFLEVGYDQTEQTANILRKVGFYDVKIRRDYANLPRVVSGIKIG